MSDPDQKKQLKNIIIGCSIAATVITIGVIALGIWVYKRMVRQLASQAGIIKPLGLGETGRENAAQDVEMGDRLPEYSQGSSTYNAPAAPRLLDSKSVS